MYTRIHQYERTNTHTQTCNCIQLGLSIYAIESQNMHTNHICSATSANINDVWPHMKRQRENKKNNKKLKCCAGFFCFGQNVIHLPAAAARTAHKADLKASLLHSMTFNHFACVCGAYEFAVNCRANRILLTFIQTSSIQLLPRQNIHNFVFYVRRRMELVQSTSAHTPTHARICVYTRLGT